LSAKGGCLQGASQASALHVSALPLTHPHPHVLDPSPPPSENGISEKGEASRTGDAALRDPLRTRYFQGYIDEACK
jgi:hypothetical protein